VRRRSPATCKRIAASRSRARLGRCEATNTNGNTAPPAAPTAKVNVEVFYVHPDHLGTPRVITASTALAATTGTGITSPQTVNKAVWRWDSDPFGSNATANSAPNENPNTLSQVVGTATLPYLFGFDLAFPGQKRDRETGKHYNYFRDSYDATIGRYAQPDPIALEGGLNIYGYVKQRPNYYADPSGLDPWYRALGVALYCTAPLHAAPALYFNGDGLFNHGYLCTSDGICGGQDWDGNPILGRGRPSQGDRLNPDKCKIVGKKDRCYLNCIYREINSPRPPYSVIPNPFAGIFGRGAPMCQEWARSRIRVCEMVCE